MDNSERIQELEEKIAKASEDYYNGTPLVTDFVFDAWVKELAELDPDNSLLADVGAAPPRDTEWEVLKHEIPMGSLAKVNTPNEMSDWLSDKYSKDGFIVSDKLDGMSLQVKYENGVAINACLRNNGVEGENILDNVKKMNGFKEKLPVPLTGFLKGEIILTFENFDKVFSERYENPRNAVPGISRAYDGNNAKYLDILFYKAISKDYKFSTYVEMFTFIKEKLGLSLPKWELCISAAEINSVYQKYIDEVRNALPYLIDGLVVDINNIEEEAKCGETNRRPKGATAFKFPPEEGKTKFRTIKSSVGNMGTIAPVGWFDPIKVGGVTIQKATLHNWARIKDLKLFPGCDIVITRRNDVIPAIEKNLDADKVTETKFEYPKKCPVCGEDTAFEGENLICTNVSTCSAQTVGRVLYWIKELNIMEWGTGLVNKLVSLGMVKSIPDIYKLTVKELASVDRMGEKSAQKVYDMLHSRKEIPLDQYLGALPIKGIGASAFASIMKSGYLTLDDILNMSRNEMLNISGIGEAKAKMIYNGLIKCKPIINELLSLGVVPKKVTNGKFVGKVFQFTGTMSHGRSDLERMVKENGGFIGSGKQLTYLVSNDPDSGSAKMRAAKKNGTAVITEEDFLALLK